MEINATGGHSSENDSHSYEEEFVLWMLTQWMDSLPFTEQIPVNHILRSLESSEFYEHLTSDDPEVGFILDAWNYIHTPLMRARISTDQTLSIYLPYA